MDQRALVRDMVTETRERLRQDGWAVGLESDMENPKGRSVSVKIRVHHDLRYVSPLDSSECIDKARKTIDFLDTVIGHPQARNVDWVTIHPRTRHTPSTTPIFTEALEILTEKYSSTLPLLLSGDVFDLSTLPLRHTKADLSTPSIKDTPLTPRPSTTHLSGFMSARGLLTNPALFAGYAACPWEAVETLMCKVARAPLPFKLALHHVQEMTGPGMGSEKGALLSKRERGGLNGCGSMVELVDFLDGKMEERMGRVMRRDL